MFGSVNGKKLKSNNASQISPTFKEETKRRRR